MREITEKGNVVTEWLLTFLAISIVIFVFLVPSKTFRNLSISNLAPKVVVPAGDGSANPTSGTSYVSQGSTGSSGAYTSYGRSISISAGNASNTIDPSQEYIFITNNGTVPIDLTGWRLENDKSSRVYAVGTEAVHYASDVAVIPQGTKILSPIGANLLSDIVLGPRERAVVVTGSPGNISPYNVVSFKENMCTGYLNSTYHFTGGLSQSCLRPSQEPGAHSFEDACSKLIDRFPSCHTPYFDAWDSSGDTTNSRGERCEGCVEGVTGLTNICTAYLKEHYSYAGCLSNHASDPNFYGSTWHIYLYRPWEMWASSHETIYLYDSAGRLAASTSY